MKEIVFLLEEALARAMLETLLPGRSRTASDSAASSLKASRIS